MFYKFWLNSFCFLVRYDPDLMFFYLIIQYFMLQCALEEFITAKHTSGVYSSALMVNYKTDWIAMSPLQHFQEVGAILLSDFTSTLKMWDQMHFPT